MILNLKWTNAIGNSTKFIIIDQTFSLINPIIIFLILNLYLQSLLLKSCPLLTLSLTCRITSFLTQSLTSRITSFLIFCTWSIFCYGWLWIINRLHLSQNILLRNFSFIWNGKFNWKLEASQAVKIYGFYIFADLGFNLW